MVNTLNPTAKAKALLEDLGTCRRQRAEIDKAIEEIKQQLDRVPVWYVHKVHSGRVFYGTKDDCVEWVRDNHPDLFTSDGVQFVDPKNYIVNNPVLFRIEFNYGAIGESESE